MPVPFVFFVREDQRAVEKRFEWRAFKAFNKTTYLAGALGMLMFVIILGANQLVNPFLQSQFASVNLSHIGMITSLWSLGIVGGSFVGGWLLRKFPAKRALYVGVALISITVLGLAYLIAPQFGLVIAILAIFFFGIAYGTYQTQYFAVAMRFVDPRIAASMYAILMAFTNIGQGIGMSLSGMLTDLTGYRNTFLILFGLNLLIIPLINRVFRRNSNAANVQA
jgi:PAT family beta-lactamase induction signal transducer AmpG